VSGDAPLDPVCTIATPEERESVIALWDACGLTRPWNDARADFARALSGPDSTILLLRNGVALIGCVMVGHDGHRGGIYYLAVDPARQREGHGRALMAAVEDWLRARGIAKLNILVRRTNEAVSGFYAALGYADNDCISLGKRLD
jgi:ribosomal protein S18 acetylase RimI-like enzyme